MSFLILKKIMHEQDQNDFKRDLFLTNDNDKILEFETTKSATLYISELSEKEPDRVAFYVIHRDAVIEHCLSEQEKFMSENIKSDAVKFIDPDTIPERIKYILLDKFPENVKQLKEFGGSIISSSEKDGFIMLQVMQHYFIQYISQYLSLDNDRDDLYKVFGRFCFLKRINPETTSKILH